MYVRDVLKKILGRNVAVAMCSNPSADGRAFTTPHPPSTSSNVESANVAAEEKGQLSASVKYMKIVMDLQQETRDILKQLSEEHTGLLDEIRDVNRRNLESLGMIGGIAIAKDSRYHDIITSTLQSILPTDDMHTRILKLNISIYGINASADCKLLSPLSLDVEGTRGTTW